MAVRDFKAWRYTDDNGDVSVRRADDFLTSQLDGNSDPKVGGSNASGLSPYSPIPRGIRPRAVYVTQVSTGYHAAVVIYNTASLLWTGAETTINVRDAGGTSHACVVYSKRGEKRRVMRPEA